MRVAKYSSEEKMAFGKNLKVYMEEHQIKSVDLAKALHISPPRMSAALKGDVSDDNIELIATYLKVSLEDLLKETVQEGYPKEIDSEEKRRSRRITVFLGVLSVLLLLSLWIFGRCEVELFEAFVLPEGESIKEVLKKLGRVRDVAHLFSVAVALVGSIAFIAMGYGKTALFWSGLALGIMVISGYGWAFYYQQLGGRWIAGNFLEPVLLYVWYGFWIPLYGVIGWKRRRKESWPDVRWMVRFGVAALLIVLLVHGGRLGIQWIRQEKEAIKVDGISLSQEDFAWVFTGDPETRKMLEDCEVGKSTLEIIDIRENDGRFRMIADLDAGNEKERFVTEGALEASFLSKSHNNAVVRIEENSGKYDVLHIHVFNSTEKNGVFFREELDGKPFLAVYMRDSSGTVYMFETELPELLRGIRATDYEMTSWKWDHTTWVPADMYRSE